MVLPVKKNIRTEPRKLEISAGEDTIYCVVKELHATQLVT